MTNCHRRSSWVGLSHQEDEAERDASDEEIALLRFPHAKPDWAVGEMHSGTAGRI